jgi:hypothetical protein
MPTRPTQHHRSIAAVTALACALLLTGCGLLGSDDGALSSDETSVDSGASESSNTDTSDPEDATDDNSDQANFDDSDDGSDDADTNDDSNDDTSDATTEPDTTTDTATDTTADSDLIPPDSQFCAASQRNDFEVRFAAGESQSTLGRTLPSDEADLYQLEVADGQVISITMRSPKDNALAAVMAPDKSVVPGRFIEQVVAPTQAGTYLICVTVPLENVEYKLTVSVIDDNTPTKVDARWCGDSVNDRGAIRFAANAFSGQAADAVIRGERDLYTVDANEGQALDVLLTSLEDNAVFTLQSPGGEIIIDEVSDFRIPLPESGTYNFCVGSVRGNASYTLDVTIE